jgi:uncharacterized membrane protein YcgQ (UPF0703/DUF1980 family)
MNKSKRSRNSFASAIFMLVLIVLFFAAACAKERGNKASDNDIVEIKEKMFISQVNDVYMNSEDYLGKTIKLEGIFLSEQYDDEPEPYCFVIRYGPGCCGTDLNAGFVVKWDESHVKPYPAIDSWVEATGTLKTAEYGDYEYLYLDLSSLAVLNKRGAETVLQ